MRTLLMTLALTIGFGAMAQEQAKPNTKAQAHQRTEKMTAVLGLDQAQQDKVYTINLRHANVMAQLDQIKGTNDITLRLETVEGQRDNALHSVLTAEQYAKMIKLRNAKAAKNGSKENPK